MGALQKLSSPLKEKVLWNPLPKERERRPETPTPLGRGLR
jgi:hypothetical protein